MSKKKAELSEESLEHVAKLIRENLDDLASSVNAEDRATTGGCEDLQNMPYILDKVFVALTAAKELGVTWSVEKPYRETWERHVVTDWRHKAFETRTYVFAPDTEGGR